MGQLPVAAPIYPRSQDTKRSIESTARNRRKDSVVQYISLCLGTLQPVGAIRRIIANRRSLRPLLYQTPALLSRAENGKLTDAGNSMSPDIERVMSLNPDAILLSPFENAGYGRIGKIGIPIIECADYLETSPLGRAEWIKFFGLLYGKEVEADSILRKSKKLYRIER